MDGQTRLSDLAVMVDPAGIDSCAGSSDLSVEFLGKLEQKIEIFPGTDSVATCNDDRGSLEVVLRNFDVPVENLHDIVFCRNIGAHVRIHGLSLVGRVGNLTFHHTFTDRSHLGTMFRIDDCRHDVAAESRTDLVEKIVVVGPGLLVVIVTDLQLGAVGGKSAGKGRRDPRA